MENAVCVSEFLLLLFSTGVQLSPERELLFGLEGGSADFVLEKSFNGYMPHLVLFRVSAGEDLLLVDCLQPKGPQPNGYDVNCVYGYPNPQGIKHNVLSWTDLEFSGDIIPPEESYLTMNNLSMSHTGEYRLEDWSKSEFRQASKRFHLTVCAEGEEDPSVEIALGGRVTLCGMNSTLGSTLQLFLFRQYPWKPTTLVLDTNSSLEPLVEDLRGRLQVDLSTSLVALSGILDVDDKSQFYCITWREDQCQNVKYVPLERPEDVKYVFANEGENVTLPGFQSWRKIFTHWSTHTGYGQITIRQADQNKVMYMLNSSQTGEYSLFIPNVSVQHSGQYECTDFGRMRDSYILQNIRLFLCSVMSPLNIMFSDSGSVCLEVLTINLMRSAYGVQWYRQNFSEPKVLLLDTKNGSLPLIDDLKGRVNMTADSSLIISNLTAEDSGLYTWRVFGLSLNFTWVCYEGSYRLVYMDPFGVHSTFYRTYAPLIGCGLLGLVAAVIWFKLRSRRGEQTSGRQSREGQQSGDEDLHEEVEMTEISG